MQKRISLILTLTVLFCCNVAVCTAAVKKVAAKPVAKKPVAQSSTVRLPGDNGVFGEVYNLRKSDPIYFRLKSAEYTTDQIFIGDRTFVPAASEKLLVLHFTVQNPQKTELYVRWDSLRFTAVDSMNVNHEYFSDWGDEKSGNGVAISLKPTQTIDAYAVIAVPAKGIVPKLMVLPESEGDGGILRYDLKNAKNKVAALKSYVSDPSDPSGYTALETVPASLNETYPTGQFDVTVLKYDTVSGELGEYTPDEDSKTMLVTLTVKCNSHDNALLRWDSFMPVMTSSEGEEIRYVDMYLAKSNRSLSKEMKFGEEMTARMLFAIPDGVEPQTLALKEVDEGRVYEYKIR